MRMTITLFIAAAVVVAVAAALFFSAPALAQPKAGEPAPAFSLRDQTGETRSLADYNGRWLVLYFYPKNDTPGCTTEACNFRDDIFKFREMGVEVVGVSLDDVESHQAFAEKYSLPFTLLSDADQETAKACARQDGADVVREARDLHHRARRHDREALREGEARRTLPGSDRRPHCADGGLTRAARKPAGSVQTNRTSSSLREPRKAACARRAGLSDGDRRIHPAVRIHALNAYRCAVAAIQSAGQRASVAEHDRVHAAERCPLIE